MKDFMYDEYTPKVLEQCPKGAFLTVKSGSRTNTMTIGWASVGYLWKRPVMTVYVRTSRYTYDLLKNASDFTVSVPLNGQLKEALSYAGKMSGRDVDKFAHEEIQMLPSEIVSSPAVKNCNVIYECRTLAHQDLEKADFDDASIAGAFYGEGNFHVVFYGEIVNYRTF